VNKTDCKTPKMHSIASGQKETSQKSEWVCWMTRKQLQIDIKQMIC